MAKGLFTQGFVILLKQYTEIEDFKPILADFKIVNESPSSDHWELGGPSLMIEFDKSVNGYVCVDVVNRPWPDHMGDAKREITLLGAWSTGHFGPYAFPGGLGRAMQQSWRWADAKAVVPQHTGFIRLKSSYVFGIPDGTKMAVIPKNYSPMKELEFLTALASTALRHPATLCYFNPSGEVLQNRELFNDSVAYHAQHRIPPLNLWTNVRLFNFSDDWLLMDSVGCWQLDIPDQEVAFPKNKFPPPEIDGFIRDTTLYLIEKGMVIKDGDTLDGPGKTRWQGKTFNNSLTTPPRQVLRWLPTGTANIPPSLLKEK